MIARLLRIFSDVRPGEATTALLMLLNLFLLMVGYYVLKTLREPLVLVSGGAEVKAYAAGAQAVALMGFVPWYSWVAAWVSRERLIVGLFVLFALNLQLFVVWISLDWPFVGFVFFVWVGIFSLASIAQFWSYANDVYTHVATVILLVHIGLYQLIEHRTAQSGGEAARPMPGADGFRLVLRNPYLRLLAVILLLAIDTFIVRIGDVLAAAVIFGGTTWLGLGVRGFAAGNLIVAAGWLVLLIPLLRRFRRLCADCP